ncbi:MULTISPECIES: TonB-dependent receptor [Dyella]|uniref:TonB-dependent receptor n=2 Tax=Dyella TaxID=231454 RepID=A0A4R0YQ19_9GAMM|nr:MULTISPECIES: TonB-dependent receptor [Dyella]TBR35947.1 TonB-dependent receptor [Dyella terrae]TCI08506.1 TonB-dependent receptor [Dyella soli]
MSKLLTHRRAPVWRHTALAVALSMGLAGIVHGQSNASGSIFGRADDNAATVHVENLDTGLARDVQVDSSGRYRAVALPIGRYRVSLVKDGKTVDTRDNVQVVVGTGQEISFTAAANAKNLEGIQVTANALPAIDVSSVDSRTVMTAEQLQKLPVLNNVNAAALLAPGTTAGDSRYGNSISMGGASAAENQYYINGFPVTNPLTGLGFTSLPFDAIDQEQVFTGGYGAEYGRSTGGVVNIITKHGSNSWKAGADVQWTPAALKANQRYIYYPVGSGRSTDGKVYFRPNENSTNTLYGAYISGPLVKDKLFFYGSGELTRNTGLAQFGINNGTNGNSTKTTTDTNKVTRWLTKVDWNITDSHILEFTGMGETNIQDTSIYNYNYNTNTVGTLKGTEHQKNTGTANTSVGGTVYVGKYTGYITDDLVISALYGKSTSDHVDTVAGSAGVVCPNITDSRSVPTRVSCAPVGGNLLAPGANDETKALRFDISYHIGSHSLRAGIDNQTINSFSGRATQGGALWTYYDATDDFSTVPGMNVPAGATEVAQRTIFSAAGKVKVEQEAQFIEDRWQISDRWLLQVGLRNEQFKNFNTDGVVFVKQRHQLAPRIGATWDVMGDSSLKVYANAGRYHLAVPANVAIRGAGPQRFENQYFTYSGVDPVTNAPINPTPISSVFYANGANGEAPDPKTLAKHGLSAYYQDEYIAGADWQFAPNWTTGAKVIYRNLKSIIDDFCDARAFLAHEQAAGTPITNPAFTNWQTDGAPCLLFNPGEGGTFTIDHDGNGTLKDITLTADELGFPKLKRKYYAVNLYLEHQFDQKWYARFEYTWSHSYGNSEGLLLSDIGQIDPSVTQTWDFPEIMIGATGNLPNDRRHQLKSYGYYQVTPEWLVGGVLLVSSGRPKNCMGIYPSDPYQYGSSYFYCNGAVATRGSQGTLPWTYQLNLSTEWRPAWADHKLAISADVFNVFNQQRAQNRVETYQLGSGAISPNYGRILSYSAPRSVRLSARYDFTL